MMQSNESKGRIVEEHARFAILFICLVAQTIFKNAIVYKVKLKLIV